MGLDMYLEAKYKEQKNTGLTGACSGLIPLAPKTENEEIGYWRKKYELSKFLWQQLGITDDDNCVPFEISEQDLLDVINFCEEKIKQNPFDDNWKYSLNTFDNALNLMREKDATIYYREWY